jgi:uncharacterized membrane protein YeaQ/YmgE (transglycosylase-associated protein family)
MIGSLIDWILIGLIAGWLAGKVMRQGHYGVVGDIIFGLIGALVGGFVASLLHLGGDLNPNNPTSWGSLALALAGAIILIFGVRTLSSGQSSFRI